MSILLFFIVLFVLILVHEWGHFIVAKKTGMRVDEFGIGFPPKIKGIKWGETEYTINWLPIGGFVRIFGENGEENEESKDAKDASRAFSARPKWAQALVLIAGVTMNILFAWFLFALTFMIGVQTAVDENVASIDASLYIAGTLPNSPASAIPAGAEIISVSRESEPLESLTPSAFSSFVVEKAPMPITVTYEYGSQSETVDIVPSQGLSIEEPNKYFIGVSLALVEVTRMNPLEAAVSAVVATKDGLVGITVGLYTLIVESIQGEADYSQIAGPIGIVGMVEDAAAFGITALLTFTAIISLNLAVINMLPFPALDGGRLLFVLIEAVTRKPIPHVWAARVNLAGFAALMLLMIAVTYNDILKLL
jgi:regulator of sigma E protease